MFARLLLSTNRRPASKNGSIQQTPGGNRQQQEHQRRAQLLEIILPFLYFSTADSIHAATAAYLQYIDGGGGLVLFDTNIQSNSMASKLFSLPPLPVERKKKFPVKNLSYTHTHNSAVLLLIFRPKLPGHFHCVPWQTSTILPYFFFFIYIYMTTPSRYSIDSRFFPFHRPISSNYLVA